jgi:ABC-type Zn uptake system ZnuABC Zn-binding protein ZnuA
MGKEAMANKIGGFSAALVMLLLAGCQSSSPAASSNTHAAVPIGNRIPEQTVRQVYESCVSSSSFAKTRGYCSCVSRMIGDQLSVEQLVEASSNPQSNPGHMLGQFREACLAQVGGLQ